MNHKLANIATLEAKKFYHGTTMGTESNLQPIANLFPSTPTWNLESWNNCWCAAFVYFCCIQAGLSLPVRYNNDSITSNFAGCIAWEQWAKLPEKSLWHTLDEKSFRPRIGDIVLFDKVFIDSECDHMGIIVQYNQDSIMVSEGNYSNVSAIVKRFLDDHIRGFVRLE